MAYSETYGNQVFNVQTFIDHGARRAGKLAEELTSEQAVSARESLFMILQSLINIGIHYWAIDKKVYGLNPDQFQYLLPDRGAISGPSGQRGGQYQTFDTSANAGAGESKTSTCDSSEFEYVGTGTALIVIKPEIVTTSTH